VRGEKRRRCEGEEEKEGTKMVRESSWRELRREVRKQGIG
jgi:hypothetical protein